MRRKEKRGKNEQKKGTRRVESSRLSDCTGTLLSSTNLLLLIGKAAAL